MNLWIASPLRVVLAAFLVAHPCAQAAEFVHLGKVEFIENQTVRLGVALKVGRIVSFQRKEGKEWLVVEDKASNPGWFWNPWGGDRVWPTAQFLLPQIYGNTGFDPVIDGQPWEVLARSESSIEFRSGLSPQLGIRIIHGIELLPSGVMHTYQVVKEQPSPFPVHVWTVTGISLPDYALLESDAQIPHPGNLPFKWWREHATKVPDGKLLGASRALKIAPSPKTKIGTYGTWIAAVRGEEAFLQVISYDPAQLYLEASNLQFYADPRQGIHELEGLSPTWYLNPGETKTWKIVWRIVDIPESAGDVQIAEILGEKAGD